MTAVASELSAQGIQIPASLVNLADGIVPYLACMRVNGAPKTFVAAVQHAVVDLNTVAPQFLTKLLDEVSALTTCQATRGTIDAVAKLFRDGCTNANTWRSAATRASSAADAHHGGTPDYWAAHAAVWAGLWNVDPLSYAEAPANAVYASQKAHEQASVNRVAPGFLDGQFDRLVELVRAA